MKYMYEKFKEQKKGINKLIQEVLEMELRNEKVDISLSLNSQMQIKTRVSED